MGDGAKMTLFWCCVALVVVSVIADPRQPFNSSFRPHRWQRARNTDDKALKQFVGPHVCRSRNSTHCCPGWTSRPNSLLCVVPICRQECGGPGACVAPNICRCPGGVEATTCTNNANGLHALPVRTVGGCRRICMNGGSCSNGTCACASGWSGEFCTEPICSEPCLHGGRCIAPDRCVCFHGLSGLRCEIDRRTGPCYTETRGALCSGALEGVVCTRQLCCASVGVAWGHPCEKCSDLDCDTGFLRNMHTKECQDIDECAAIPGLCSGGRCINSIGSFSCECPPGQRRHPNTNNCEDIDECQDSDICPNGRCVNTEGDYYCLCNPHFIQSPDKKFCIDGRVGQCFTYLGETGECSDRLPVPLSNRDCCCGFNMGRAWGELCSPCPPRGSTEYSHLCGGGPVPPSWRRNDSSSEDEELAQPIVKINECMLRSGICGLGTCKDKDVGYVCECWSGAESVSRDGHPVCMDIDECALGYCSGGRCENSPGGFICHCPVGFDPVDGGRRCSDADECEASHGAMCSNGKCTNVDGGFECSCLPGYELSPTGVACIDVDECSSNIHVCRRGSCLNTQGSYSCRCDPGFTLAPAGYCIDIDECSDGQHCQGGVCVNQEGSFQCVCEGGFRLEPSGGACLDVDECLDPSLCKNAKCRNTPGSFRCDCKPGFTLAPDGRSCRDEVKDLCYEKFEEGQCQGPGAMPITKSQCCCGASKGLQLGWGVSCKACPSEGSEEYSVLCPEGNSRDNDGNDINECVMTPGVCIHGTCENTEPGFRCICDPGFYSDEQGNCRDIDECDMHQSLCSGGVCRNTVGSFTCSCPSGTRTDDRSKSCVDIDECSHDAANPCDNGRCMNTHGGYECECEPGFVLDSTARHCIDNRRGSCWSRVVDGSCESASSRLLLRQECCCGSGLAWGAPCQLCEPSHCPCEKGYAKLDGISCRDLDECAIDPDLCVGGQCLNTDGSYKCICPEGQVLDSTNNRCIDTRHEVCFTDYSAGRCSNPVKVPVLKAVCCCSALGKAWGDAKCEGCPKKGTDGYRALCIAESEGSPKIWSRPINNVSNIDNVLSLTNPDWPNGPNDRDALIPGQLDVNECSAFPGLCGNGVCRNLPGTFTCDCFPGYEKEPNGHACVDVDECEIVSDVCGRGLCRNTKGGFHCECHTGYQADPYTKVCVDINECAEGIVQCVGGRCVNTPGSYRCECGPGMELSVAHNQCKDIDECSTTSGICSNGACENQMGTYQCVCDEGYAQSRVKSHCEDIDECAEDPTRCEHECVNTPGSYHCTCRDGWHLRADGRSCRDVDECSSGARVCGGGLCRNTPGSYTCTCEEGLLHDTSRDKPTCKDVDECAEIPDLCGAGECRNTIGSFVCLCPEGYSVKPEQGPACTDDDECEMGTCDCDPNADCVNLPGSFSCRCREGWRGSGSSCDDVDECVSNSGGCSPHATCVNSQGSFTCVCEQGYRGDGYSCVDIDECANDPTLCENGHCSNTAGGYECDCDVGFTKAQDGKSCLDLDECSTFDNVCVFGRCENTYGMFKCICDKGYQPDSVDDLMPGFNCTDVDECQSPQSCQYGECVNTPGAYQCRCPPNHDLVSDGTACFDGRRGRCYGKIQLRSGDEQCHEGDELSKDGSLAGCCCSVGMAWGNYCDLCPEPGSEEYRQLCPGGPGYQPVLEPPSYVVTLSDIDECEQHPQLCSNGSCTNTFGSFVCSCGEGWILDEDRHQCVDVDECDAPEVCGPGVCRNLPGSYVCLCPEGYVPMPSGKECVDVRQRQCYMEWDDVTSSCSNAVGVAQTQYLCCCSVGKAWGSPCKECPAKDSKEHLALCGERPGEYLNPVTNETKPIDECSLMPQLCKPGACHDTTTGFHCACDHGYSYDSVSHICRDVDECLSSPCESPAICVNSAGSFECHCPSGFIPDRNGRRCLDVDECARDGVCEHGVCRNVQGSYRCECKAGYTLRDNVCRDIDECSRPRPMCRNGTCENLPGSYTCHCHTGFKLGANNDCVDINECREGGLVCRNGRCRNSVGSFSCECSPGYTLEEDERNCRDLDECSEITSPCGQQGDPVCTNTNGGYECSCGKGFRLSGRQCIDRDECRESDVCANGDCYNLDGGFRCECPPGWRFEEISSSCVDDRKELCFEAYDEGRCHYARPLTLSRPECCCSEGSAWGRYCERCPTEGTPEFKQICQGGMGRPNMTQDLDECSVRPDVCVGGVCVNTDGSFRCECPKGHTLDATGVHCVDMDECAMDVRVCGNGTCTNTLGSYECQCNAGFTQGNDQRCVDIDECALGVGGCAFRCHNSIGSFRCTCPSGYELHEDKAHCRDIDECLHNPCKHKCENVVGSYICKCPEGYKRSSSPHDSPDACVDIDECSSGEHRCANGVCINSDGDYYCECDSGYEPAEDMHSCVDHRAGMCHRTLVSGRCAPEPWSRQVASTQAIPMHVTKAQCCCTVGVAWGSDCELCPTPNSVERSQLCSSASTSVVVRSGLPSVAEALDIDECAAMPGLCAPGRCVNTIGSFRCVCGPGYKSSGDVCVDIDECSARVSPCEHMCQNTEGSYTCLCRSGYEVDEDGALCIDVDECERDSHTCQQICSNTRGSYECSCQEGYEKRGDACVDINECLSEDLCPSPGKCINLLGSYRCSCPRGMRVKFDRCVDRDECADGLCGGQCRNYVGGHRCDCPSGSTRSASGCISLDPCSSSPCGPSPCVPLGGSFSCLCPQGYHWDTTHNVCLQLSGGCASANCLFGCNSFGSSYSCGCPTGYSLVGAGHCIASTDAGSMPDDFGNVPLFPLTDQFKADADKDVISTEGCFSCKMGSRHRRAPDEGIVFANGTTIMRKKRRKSRRGRRAVSPPETELVVIKVTPKQTWNRAPLLRLLPAESGYKPHYRITYGDDDKDFLMSKRDGAWALRLRRHLKPKTHLERQLEIEAKFVPIPNEGWRRKRHLEELVPSPLKLYVSVKIKPESETENSSDKLID